MIISLINRSNSLADARVQTVVRAVNRQIRDDFAPCWSFGATLRLEGSATQRLRTDSSADLRGDAILYLVDGSNALEATGWHAANFRDVPYGIVFLGLCEKMHEDWSVTLSHEALELIGDPLCNLLVEGCHPLDRRKRVLHLFEMCDAVQAETYTIDGVALSNFVLPSYFSLGEQAGRRNDFLGTAHDGRRLQSFGMNPGAYLNIFDPATRKWSQPVYEDDALARRRKRQKSLSKAGRGYRRMHPAALSG